MNLSKESRPKSKLYKKTSLHCPQNLIKDSLINSDKKTKGKNQTKGKNHMSSKTNDTKTKIEILMNMDQQKSKKIEERLSCKKSMMKA